MKLDKHIESGWSENFQVIPGLICVADVVSMVREKLENFLHIHEVDEMQIDFLLMGVTEAIENAIKYGSDNTPIQICYSLENKRFCVEMINEARPVSPERDIEAGKYSPGGTLMRGMLVMEKVFDTVGIDLEEKTGTVVFSAIKSL